MIEEETIKPYNEDVQLLKKLGLNYSFTGKAGWEKIYLGKVSDDSYEIDVWVTCTPSQFWNFHIKCLSEDYEYDVMSGSGDLSTHWSAIELLAKSRIRVDMIKINGIIKYKK